MKYLINFIKPVLIVVITSVLYLKMVRPIRGGLNNQVFHPVLSSIYTHKDIKPHPTQIVLQIHSKDSDNSFLFKLPFGGFYIVPAISLAMRKNWNLLKALTYYHLFLFLVMLIFLLPIFDKVLHYIPDGPFKLWTEALGLFFTLLAIKDYSKDYE